MAGWNQATCPLPKCYMGEVKREISQPFLRTGISLWVFYFLVNWLTSRSLCYSGKNTTPEEWYILIETSKLWRNNHRKFSKNWVYDNIRKLFNLLVVKNSLVMIKWPYFLEFHAKLRRSYEIAYFNNNLNERTLKWDYLQMWNMNDG